MAVSARLRSISEHLWLVTTRHGTFGSLLGLRLQRDGGPLRFQRLDAATSEVSVPLPAWAARRDGTLCLGAALALADEVSTYAGTALWDQRKRPGVTITISGQLVGRAQVAPGEELTIVTRPLKSGKSLAHVEMDVMRGDELLMSGRHSKFMSPSSRILQVLELFGHPYLYPFLQPLWVRWLETQPEPAPLIDAPATRADVFPALTRVEPAAAGGARTLLAVPGSLPPTLYRTAARAAWRNLLGGIHGGAACMLLEQAAAASYCDAVGADEAPPARAMTVTLLSSIACDGKREALLEGQTSPADDSGGAFTLATGRDAGGRSRAIEAAVWWSDTGR